MPYIHTYASTSLTSAQVSALREAVKEHITLLPRKTFEVTMIHISGSETISLNEYDVPAAFVDLRLLGPSPLEAKKAFTEAYISALSGITGIDKKHIYLNITEMNEWGANGGLAHL